MSLIKKVLRFKLRVCCLWIMKLRFCSRLQADPTSGSAPWCPRCCVIRQAQGPPGCTGWLHSFTMGSSAVTVTALALNTRTHAHMRTAPTHPTAVAHTHSHRRWSLMGTLRYGGVGGGGARGDSPDRRHASRLVDEAEKPLRIVMVGWSLPFSRLAAHKSGRQKLK